MMIRSHLTKLINNEIDPLFACFVTSDGRMCKHYDTTTQAHAACHAALQNNGRTALMAAAVHNSKEAVKLLLENGADRAAKGTGGFYDGKTALDWANEKNYDAIIQLLEVRG